MHHYYRVKLLALHTHTIHSTEKDVGQESTPTRPYQFCACTQQAYLCRSGRTFTRTAMCNTHQVEVIPAGQQGQISLQQISNKMFSILKNIDTEKRHSTVGFYSNLVRTAVKVLGEEASGRVQKKVDKIAWAGDVGGFRDVGGHQGVKPLATCWPLVEQVFYYLAEQVRYSDPSFQLLEALQSVSQPAQA